MATLLNVRPLWGLAAGTCALLAVLSPAAQAATLRIAPVRIEMDARKQFCALTIANDSTEPTTVQIRSFSWSKDAEGNDQLDPGSGPVINPSIVTIPGQQSRLIRCSLPATAGPREESYRLVIDELPTSAAAPGVIRTLLRVSIPVFRAQARATPALFWSPVKASDGQPRIMLENRGTRHVQALSISLHRTGPDNGVVRLDQGFYLLAGGHQQLPIGKADVDRVELNTVEGQLTAAPASSER